MFLSPNEQVSVENLLKGIVTLSGNDASVVLAECIAGTEQAFTDQMNALAKRIGLTNSHFGTANGWPDNGVTYVTARDLATLARCEIEHHSSSTSSSIRCRASPGARRWAGQDITQANRNPILGQVPGADGLKTGHTDEAGYGFTGSAEQNGRRLIEVARRARQLECARPGIDAAHRNGASTPGRPSRCSRRARRSDGQVQLGSSSRCRWSRRAISRSPFPRACRAARSRCKIRYQGPVTAPIAKGQHIADLVDHHRRHAAAGRAAGRRRGCRQGGILRPHLARPQVAVRDGVTQRGKFISLEGGEGVGKSTRFARSPRR